ncbi:rhodanese-like domain-containing protein [Candidatus Micrarchaeota archaeon]|nr:rhodanese-like domain-containing protein [Candidatus Micrarchaeota archaeon]MBU2476283.1 rhodanese-like domain-containing protein [Candidatus Micrarchaeota archaeon]
MKKIIGVLVLLLFAIGCINSDPKIQIKEEKISFTNISAQELKQKLEDKDFFLLDVHIPEQEHIQGTDEFIAFDKIEENINKLPKNKETPIILYCRSGNMSITASEKLIELGYKNVMNLEGGIKAFNSLN